MPVSGVSSDLVLPATPSSLPEASSSGTSFAFDSCSTSSAQVLVSSPVRRLELGTCASVVTGMACCRRTTRRCRSRSCRSCTSSRLESGRKVGELSRSLELSRMSRVIKKSLGECWSRKSVRVACCWTCSTNLESVGAVEVVEVGLRKFVCSSTQEEALAHGLQNHIHASEFLIHQQLLSMLHLLTSTSEEFRDKPDSLHSLESRFPLNPPFPNFKGSGGERYRARLRIERRWQCIYSVS